MGVAPNDYHALWNQHLPGTCCPPQGLGPQISHPIALSRSHFTVLRTPPLSPSSAPVSVRNPSLPAPRRVPAELDSLLLCPGGFLHQDGGAGF